MLTAVEVAESVEPALTARGVDIKKASVFVAEDGLFIV